MSFVVTAVVGSAAIGAGASIYGSTQQTSAAKGAAAAQQDVLIASPIKPPLPGVVTPWPISIRSASMG